MAKVLTKIELQMKVAALEAAANRAKVEGHTFIVSECRKVANLYKRRIKRMEAKEQANG